MEGNAGQLCHLRHTRRSERGALQLQGVHDGIHTRRLDDRLEMVITDDAVDEHWQLRDLEALVHPHPAQIRTIDAQMVQALEDSQ